MVLSISRQGWQSSTVKLPLEPCAEDGQAAFIVLDGDGGF
jgi:hypothetical protein